MLYEKDGVVIDSQVMWDKLDQTTELIDELKALSKLLDAERAQLRAELQQPTEYETD